MIMFDLLFDIMAYHGTQSLKYNISETNCLIVLKTLEHHTKFNARMVEEYSLTEANNINF